MSPVIRVLRHLAPALALTATALACATSAPELSDRVRVERDPAVDLAGFGTWAWVRRTTAPMAATRSIDPDVHEAVRNATEHWLGAKGYEVASDGTRPDLAVTYHIGIEAPLAAGTAGRNWYGDAWGLDAVADAPVETGVLVIDVSEIETRRLVWRGQLQTGLAGASTRSERQAHARRATRLILERFP